MFRGEGPRVGRNYFRNVPTFPIPLLLPFLPMKISLSIPDELMARVDARRAPGQGRSWIVQRLLEEALDARGGGDGGVGGSSGGGGGVLARRESAGVGAVSSGDEGRADGGERLGGESGAPDRKSGADPRSIPGVMTGQELLESEYVSDEEGA